MQSKSDIVEYSRPSCDCVGQCNIFEKASFHTFERIQNKPKISSLKCFVLNPIAKCYEGLVYQRKWRRKERLLSRSQLSSQVKGFKAQKEQSNKYERRGPGNKNLCLCLCLCCSHSTFWFVLLG